MSAPRKHWHLECVTSEAKDIEIDVITSWFNGDLERIVVPVPPTGRLLWMLFKSWFVGTPAVFDFKVTVAKEDG